MSRVWRDDFLDFCRSMGQVSFGVLIFNSASSAESASLRREEALVARGIEISLSRSSFPFSRVLLSRRTDYYISSEKLPADPNGGCGDPDYRRRRRRRH